MGYEDIPTHLMMLADERRCTSYEAAIQKTVRPGQHVIDFGCGTGILSFFASRCGARRVSALDKTTIVRTAKMLAVANEFTNIDFYLNDADTVSLPEKADVIISEWMGCFVFHEWMLEPLIRLRDRYLKDNGTMVPRRVDLRVGFVTDETLVKDLRFFRTQPYGLDFSPIEDWPLFTAILKTVTERQVLPEYAEIGALDMHRIQRTPEQLSGRVRANRNATLYGLCGWFDAELAEGINLSTSPFAPPTHWNQIFFPFDHPVDVNAGEEMKVSLLPSRRSEDEATLWQWSFATETASVQMDNFVYRAWAGRPLTEGKVP